VPLGFGTKYLRHPVAHPAGCALNERLGGGELHGDGFVHLRRDTAQASDTMLSLPVAGHESIDKLTRHSLVPNGALPLPSQSVWVAALL
jgi:hypothetical protein